MTDAVEQESLAANTGYLKQIAKVDPGQLPHDICVYEFPDTQGRRDRLKRTRRTPSELARGGARI